MKLRPWIKVILVGAAIVSLAACSTGRKKHTDGVNGENYSDASTTSGVGDETRFGDQADGTRHVAANGRVYYFDYDSNVVHDTDKPAIATNATKLSSNGDNGLLEGHTDPRGSREYNIGLGERRAKAVAQLMTEHGVNPKQIRVVSYGAEKPASPGTSEADYQQDRRVVLVYSQK